MADTNDRQSPRATVDLTVRQEKMLLRPTGSRRHAVFGVRATMEEAATPLTRRPLTLALTLDRSGSMSGEPLRMAKQVALSLLDSLTEQDEAAVVIFDDKIETLQELAAMTPAVKERLRRELGRVEARGSTALHEAWLTSCDLLASDDPQTTRLARCYLLTDGQANVGETDVETIATQAAGMREKAGVGTSAFGLGLNYNEHLLGPWAVAGGGQFHNLRTIGDLAKTFMGERDELLAVVALRARLEVVVAPGMSAEMISAYRLAESDRTAERWQIDIGDLLNAEERDIVVRFSFPRQDKAYTYTVRARVIWIDDRGEQYSPWQDFTFTSASDEACSDEPRDAETMRWIGLAHAERTKIRALELANRGDSNGAVRLLRQAISRINAYAGDDAQLHAAIGELNELANTIERRALSPRMAKEAYYTSQIMSRKQRDFRGDD